MSTPKPGSPGGTPGRYIPIGYNELARLQRELFGLVTTLNEMKSRIRSAEQTVESLASYVERLVNKAWDHAIDTREESMSDSFSSTTHLKRSEPSFYVKGHWTLSPSGEWVYERSPFTDPDFLRYRSGSSTDSIPTTSSRPSTMIWRASALTVKPSEPSGTDSSDESPGH